MADSDGLSLCDRILAVEEGLAGALMQLNFGEAVTFVYNPLDYAAEPHRNFVRKYLSEGGAKVLFLGMNPGPFGMAQTGNALFEKTEKLGRTGFATARFLKIALFQVFPLARFRW